MRERSPTSSLRIPPGTKNLYNGKGELSCSSRCCRRTRLCIKVIDRFVGGRCADFLDRCLAVLEIPAFFLQLNQAKNDNMRVLKRSFLHQMLLRGFVGSSRRIRTWTDALRPGMRCLQWVGGRVVAMPKGKSVGPGQRIIIESWTEEQLQSRGDEQQQCR